MEQVSSAVWKGGTTRSLHCRPIPKQGVNKHDLPPDPNKSSQQTFILGHIIVKFEIRWHKKRSTASDTYLSISAKFNKLVSIKSTIFQSILAWNFLRNEAPRSKQTRYLNGKCFSIAPGSGEYYSWDPPTMLGISSANQFCFSKLKSHWLKSLRFIPFLLYSFLPTFPIHFLISRQTKAEMVTS